MPSSQPLARALSGGEDAVQNRSSSGGSSMTRNAHPWLNPALGAWTALDSIRSTTARSTGRSAYRRTILLLRTTSWNSMPTIVARRRGLGSETTPSARTLTDSVGSRWTGPVSFEQMWRDLAPVGRSAASGGYFRQPFASAEREATAWFREQCAARSLDVEVDRFGNLVGWWRPVP